MSLVNYNSVSSDELVLKTPFRMTISGPSGSGKTQWIRRFIKYRDSITDHKFDLIMFVYGEYQPLFDEIKTDFPEIIWCEGFSHELITNHLQPNGMKKLLIVDDLLQEVANDKFFHTFYIRRSHHWDVSILFTTQYLHEKGLRLVNLNTTHYILFRSFRDETAVRAVGLQIYPSKWRLFMEIYKQATR